MIKDIIITVIINMAVPILNAVIGSTSAGPIMKAACQNAVTALGVVGVAAENPGQ